MASQEGCVTVNWDICNFSLLLKVKEIHFFSSPDWVLENTKGRVVRGKLSAYHSYSQINFFVCALNGHLFRTEMFFISSYGDVLLKASPSRSWFDLPKSALFGKNRQSILLNDTLTLCCKTWGKAIKTSESQHATVFHIMNPIWTIENFSSSDFHDAYIEQENAKLHVSLKKDGCRYWVTVELGPHAPGGFFFADGTLSVKDSCGRGSIHHMFNRYNSNGPLFSIGINSKSTEVTLHLELLVALHGRPELSTSSQLVRETPLKPSSPTNTAQHKNVSGALGDDFLLLYRDSALSDATLNTEGKSFSAHRAVLAARSPVFRAMFEKDETSEGQSGVVDIDDVDSETVDRMLVYLYADSVGDLAWQEATALYYAADKFEILPLKEKCANFLKDCLTADNACDVLVLADRHSDQELMTRVVNFILGHEEVVSSTQWMELEEGYPRLCAKITRELFLKRGRKKMRV